MKTTTYIVEITNQKNEKCLSEGRNPLLTNQAARFISRGIGRPYFFANFLLSFLL